ncbi:PREDICTED: RE1-silencing transcription factor-like isoform X2 [Papilio xuthus]|uniref:RE1-silencing transcription factor-like isoform X2 n=1 Tax=Papilio xuthus TaxID=66420 RepID=A0AAJ7E858_PAPXU|nr:PREDICTED: RE1-silencing transcription factor-like isoform X2 [Papilio xuthus]
MEKRKEHLSAMKVCRFCLAKNSSLGSLYRRQPPSKKTVDLPLKILSCVSIEVFPSDRMPRYICSQCKVFMNLFYTYKQMVRQADERILKYTQNGMPLEPVSWPTSLIKAYQSSSEQEIKTVLEGGATVQISTHNISESDEEEEDENVFNVEGDGSDDESKGDTASIKLITSKNNEDSPKNVMKRNTKGFTRPLEEENKLYSCKHCSKTFNKSHHYTRHLRIKHRENIRTSRGPFGATEQFRCEQCDDTFSSQDDLIYHSAIHATQNLICPLCQEKFQNVDAVTAHIKSHVNGVEFMCDFCELVFTTKEKLECHLVTAHEDEFNNELGQDESSMEMDPEEEDDDNSINVKDEGDHMLIEIKKPDEYMLHNTTADSEEKGENSISEESEPEVTYTELSTVDTLAIIKKDLLPKVSEKRPASVTITRESSTEPVSRTEHAQNTQVATVVRKNSEKGKEVQPAAAADTEKKDKVPKPENVKVTATNKSLQLLEKELQELKRTNNTRNETKPAMKLLDSARGKRPVIHTSTPKFRPSEDRRVSAIIKMPSTEKKIPERRVITKENKEPKEKETKEVKEVKEVKEIKVVNTSTKEETDTTTTPKSVIKNGNNEKSQTEDGVVRRSTRPSKIKDYAKMIRDRSLDDDEDDTEESDIEEEYRDKTPERTPKRKTVVKGPAKMIQTTITTTPQGKVVQTTMQAGPTATPTMVATMPRKRGRPRKDAQIIPAKVKKDEENNTSKAVSDESVAKETPAADEKSIAETKNNNVKENTNTETKTQTTTEHPQIPPNLLVYPMGQTLKKVPVKSLPPGVKPIPLPANARPLAARELCEMQIGKKMVKVQKIVMTKAEVEAMAKKGLVEMKDGTMVLKQGIKLPTASDPAIIKSTLVGEKDAIKESPAKKEKSTPSRCDLSDEA